MLAVLQRWPRFFLAVTLTLGTLAIAGGLILLFV
jgi:hypothetical protein